MQKEPGKRKLREKNKNWNEKHIHTDRKVDEWMHYTKLNMRRVWTKKSWFLPLLEYIKIFDRSANGQSIAVVLSILSVWKLHSTFIRTGFKHNFVALASASLNQFFRFFHFIANWFLMISIQKVWQKFTQSIKINLNIKLQTNGGYSIGERKKNQ